MDKERMIERGLDFTSRQFGKLDGYKLAFNKKSKQGMAANIEPSNYNYIEGVIYDFPDKNINYLDSKEGYPNHYDRIQVTVIDSDGTSIQATTYIAMHDKIVNGHSPNREYLNHLLAGQDILSKEYFDKLSKTQTCD